MTAEEALNKHFEETGIYSAGCTRDDWYPGNWVALKVGRFILPIFPILNRNGPIVLHDLHHMLAGYPPTWRGEAEVAAWEIASGGCRWHLFYWFDRLSFLLVGIVAAPLATSRAFKRGRKSRNLFGQEPEEMLRSDVEDLASYARV